MAQTLKQAIKAVSAYAKKHGENYINVEQVYLSNFDDASVGHFKWRAYINSFGIWAQSETIEGLIEQFDAVLAKRNGEPVFEKDTILEF